MRMRSARAPAVGHAKTTAVSVLRQHQRCTCLAACLPARLVRSPACSLTHLPTYLCVSMGRVQASLRTRVLKPERSTGTGEGWRFVLMIEFGPRLIPGVNDTGWTFILTITFSLDVARFLINVFSSVYSVSKSFVNKRSINLFNFLCRVMEYTMSRVMSRLHSY